MQPHVTRVWNGTDWVMFPRFVYDEHEDEIIYEQGRPIGIRRKNSTEPPTKMPYEFILVDKNDKPVKGKCWIGDRFINFDEF